MPTYDNQINWGTGFKFGQGVPVDDRFVFNNVIDADNYITTHSFFIYEGLWAYLIDPGDYYFARRINTALPWDGLTNPYIWIQFSGSVGGLPILGLPDQQLVVNSSGATAEYNYFNARGLFTFIGAATANPTITEGMFVRQTSSAVFQDMYTIANYPINSLAKLPLYFVFKVNGNDLVMGKFGIYRATAHQLPQRELLYLRTTHTIGNPTYYLNLLTTVPSSTDGEYNLVVGNAIDSNNILIDLTRNATLIGSSSGSNGNASIFRTKIQKFGVGGIPPNPIVGTTVVFTIPHGFGATTGIVQVVDFGLTGAFPGTQIMVDQVIFKDGEVDVVIDYGIVDDNSILEVVLIF